MKKPHLKISGVSSWVKTTKQKRKEKEEEERSLESSSLKMFTFLVTAIAMALGMSYLPIFPQPLPILIAILVAFAVYQNPRLGMPFGGVVIGFGLMYHLAELQFISFIGEPPFRVAFVVFWLILLIVLPLTSNRYKSALAIDFGILSVVCLFFAPLYFLAIPLILASAVYFKKYVSLSVTYFVLLMVPLQIMQYYTYVVKPIVRSDWWLEAGSAPPLLVPLSSIAKDISSSVDQFRLYDMSKVVTDIAGQTTWIPDWKGRSIGDAVVQYRDSIPGLLMFVVIVVGLAITLMFFTRMMVKGGIINAGDKFFQIFTATIAAAVFFVLLSALQVPLAFTADVSPVTMILGIFATLLLTVPVLFIDTKPKQTTSFSELTQKAQDLKDKLRILQAQLDNVKENIPVIVSGPEGKTLIMKDSVDEMLKNILNRVYDQSELDEKLLEISNLSKGTDAIETDLNTILSEYQIFSACQLSDWIGKLKAGGLDIKTALSAPYEKEMPLEQRIDAIKQILEAGRALTREVIDVTEPIYGIIKPLYDPSLPEKSRAVEFSQEKLAKKEAPWIAVEALYNSLNNWKRQYGSDIQASMRYLRTSLTPIARLSTTEDLAPVFGENTLKVIGYAKRAEDMKADAELRAEKEELDILDVVVLKDDVQGFLNISNDILSMLYTGLITDEEAIDRLLPTKDYLWEKNTNLRERLKTATETLGNPSNYKINQIMENLPTYLSYLDEALQTLAVYSERKEFLLNYPAAEAAINEQLKEKQTLLPQDLPFPPRFAAEYLRLYYTTRFGEYAFDKDNFVLTKRP